MDQYEIEAAYETDPVGTTNAVVQAAAAQAAAELAQPNDLRRETELARVQHAELMPIMFPQAFLESLPDQAAAECLVSFDGGSWIS